MFVRTVTINLKPGEASGYTQAIDQKIIPMMRACAGFRDEIVLVSGDGMQTIAMSFWDRREDADAYSRDVYPKVVDALNKHFDGIPVVQNYNLTNSTVHAITGKKAGA